jgi:hypothetical protein
VSENNKPPKSNCANFAVWNMDGGPIPEKVMRRLEGAFVSIIKDSENRVRLLHTVVRD